MIILRFTVDGSCRYTLLLYYDNCLLTNCLLKVRLIPTLPALAALARGTWLHCMHCRGPESRNLRLLCELIFYGAVPYSLRRKFRQNVEASFEFIEADASNHCNLAKIKMSK